jgi:hypothetical protein
MPEYLHGAKVKPKNSIVVLLLVTFSFSSRSKFEKAFMKLKRLFVLAMLAMATASLTAQTFTNTGSMITARYWAAAALLPNGKVLVAGGTPGDIAAAELYDPSTGIWTATAPMNYARNNYTMTLLPNGKVLVAGGYSYANGYLSSAELYDPATGTWTLTGSLHIGRNFHTAALLANGNVLVVGGQNASIQDVANAEIFDPASGTWSIAGALNIARQRHTETLLPNGKVLVAGGSTVTVGGISSAELYDPATGNWTMTGTMNSSPAFSTASLLPNGKVLVAGGYNNSQGYLNSAELYDPATGTWTLTSAMNSTRCYHTATLLPNGQVLVAGGQAFWPPGDISGAELYDYVSGTWIQNTPMNNARNHHTATLLPNGQVLIAGGIDNSTVFSSSELYLNTVIARYWWSLADGGNDHVYELIQSSAPISWTDARDAAVARGGYLATVTSSAENTIVGNLGNLNISWIGGFQPPGSAEPAGGWSWVTGEPFNYTHWYYSEPNNGGTGAQDYIVMWNAYGDSWWVDNDNLGQGWATSEFVVEYDGIRPPPKILTQPTNEMVQFGSGVVFSVIATSPSPLSYQWRFNGQNISNATSAALTLNSVTAANSGSYSVIVSNPYGSVASATVSLKLLADPANGNPTAQISPLFCPLPAANVDSLILVTHGVEPLYQINPWGDISWITNMANAIRAKAPSNWEVRTLDWTAVSQATEPDIVSLAGTIGGHLYGSQLGQQRNWKHIHLIGHSAGASVIEAIASELKALPPASRPIIHETFLDPYLGSLHQLQSYFGSHSDWSDNYFAANGLSLWTNAKLPHAHNVDVSWLDTADISYVTNYWSPSGMADTTPATIYEQQVPSGVQAYVGTYHGWPHDFYQDSITNGPPNAAGYGWPLSEENGWNNFAGYPINNDPVVLNGQLANYQNLTPAQTGLQVPFSLLPNATSSSGVNFTGSSGAMLFTTLSQSSFSQNGHGVHPNGGGAATNVPAWLSVGLTITNPVDFVQFDAAFTDANSAQGLLTVYWDTNQIGMVDERVASTNWQTYRFALPSTVTNDDYVLGFRLDSFNSTLSSVAVTNVATGFAGVNQPLALGVALFTNSTPILQLTGASNYNYLVESSTNLVDWTPTALLVNSNGTVFFADPTAKNSSTKFYRAVRP